MIYWSHKKKVNVPILVPKFTFYISILLLIINTLIIPTITAYPVINVETEQNISRISNHVHNEISPSQNYSNQSSLMYGDHYKPSPLFYNKEHELFAYSTLNLQYYFDSHHYTEKEILACDTLYISDEFIQLAKTLPKYEHSIKNLYHKLYNMGWLGRVGNIPFGCYCSGLFKKVEKLYREIKQIKKLLSPQAEQFAHTYNINLINLFPNNKSTFIQNIYQNYIHILNEVSLIPQHNIIARDCIGQASNIGLEANKNGHTKQASQLADFCWTIIDLSKAFGEGIYLGTSNTIAAITHPIETIKNSLIGIGIITYGLSKLVSIPMECAFLYATDRNCFYIETNTIHKQLTTIIQNAIHYAQTTPTRNIVKQSSAFITESILLTKICTFTHNAAKQLLPIMHNYFEYITKKESTACLANGTVIEVKISKNTKHSYTQNIIASLSPEGTFGQTQKQLNITKNILAESTISADIIDGLLIIDHPVINNIRTGSALKLDAHHAFPNIIDNFVRHAEKFNIKGNDGIVRELYQIEGSLNGHLGIFEWIVDPRINLGVIHRIFIKNGKTTGKPNVFVRN